MPEQYKSVLLLPPSEGEGEKRKQRLWKQGRQGSWGIQIKKLKYNLRRFTLLKRDKLRRV